MFVIPFVSVAANRLFWYSWYGTVCLFAWHTVWGADEPLSVDVSEAEPASSPPRELEEARRTKRVRSARSYK